MSTRTNAPKKVRLACRRCRTRRIKCDGQTPACTNCAKAGQICLDVDSQNSDIVIPRNYAAAARARIQWLEDIIRERLPDVDLQSGPQVEQATEPVTRSQDEGAPEEGDGSSLGQTAVTSVSEPASRKRPAEAPVQSVDEAFTEKAHSVSMNLGMLSLNIDSPQKHYLGSSSGLLFTNLIGASPPSAESTPQAPRSHTNAGDLEWLDGRAAQDYNTKYYRALNAFLKQELPSKHDAYVLVQTYVRWIHPDFPFLEPISLFSALEALYSCLDQLVESDVTSDGWSSAMPPFRWNGRYVVPGASEDESIAMPCVAFVLFMVMNIGALVKVRSRIYEFPPQKFYRAALHFSKDAFSQISLASIQGLMMLVMHSLLTPAEVNLWTLVHLGLAYCVEIGIHREQNQVHPNDFAIQQIRRYTFFTIYSLDRSISSIQGRPLGFRDETFDVLLPQAPNVADSQIGGPVPPSFMEAVASYSAYQFKLDRIISDIKLHLYHLPGDSSWFPWPENPCEHQQRIKATLDRWWEETSRDPFESSSLDNRQREVWRLKLKIRYHTTMVLLFQPSQVIRKPSPESLQICFNSSSSILEAYQRSNDLHSLHFGWRAVQNIFAAGATLIYSFWTSQLVRRNASQSSMSKNLRNCSNLLTIGGEWWPSAKDGQKSFGSVADLTMRKLYMDDAPIKIPRLSLQQSAADQSGHGLEGDQLRNQPGSALPGGQVSELDPLPLMESDDAWQRLEGDVGEAHNQILWQGIDVGFDPEIEMFLADFDRSDFTWSFPLNGNQDSEHLEAHQNPVF